MRLLHTWVLLIAANFGAIDAYSFNTFRTLSLELDPLAPATSLATRVDNFRAEEWGGQAEFNVTGRLATGPEVWIGNFKAQGPADAAVATRREDLQYGEQQKVDATRLRWCVTLWEIPMSMRGWYIKAGYAYTRVNSRANRLYGWETNLEAQDPMESTDLVTDIRHGGVVGFGQRWLFFDQRATLTVGLSYTQNFRRDVSLAGRDPDARADYDAFIEDAPSTKISARALPETNVGFGYVI